MGPVYDSYFADPFAFRVGDEFFAVGTDPTQDELTRVFRVLRSRDLLRWESVGFALDRPGPGLGTDFWAPEVAVADDGFYMYYSVGFADKGHHLRVAFSSTPEGPYRDLGALTNLQSVPFAIDACPFRDEDGQWYLYYAVDFLNEDEGYRAGTALVVDRLVDMTKLAGEPRTVSRATQDWQRWEKDRVIYDRTWDWHTLEGPSVVKRGGRYWCLYSGGNWQNDTYGVDFCVAEHPLGPFGDCDVEAPRLLKTIPDQLIGPGHNSVVVGPDGRDWIVYHAWDQDRTMRQMHVAPLRWSDSGPSIADQ